MQKHKTNVYLFEQSSIELNNVGAVGAAFDTFKLHQ